MRNIIVKEILSLLEPNDQVLGDTTHYFNNVQPSETVNENSLDWINEFKKDKLEYLLKSKAKVIICDSTLEISDDILLEKCIIKVQNPKLCFLRIVDAFFTEETAYQIHSTAITHPKAVISSKCSIGPFSFIGKCEIQEGTIIYGHCYIYDNVFIGKNVIIHAGAVIGSDGFGYQRNKQGVFEKFPHIGGVIIKDNVEIGSNTSIDRGTLGNTILEEGVKVDNLVHIAHNVKVGKHSAIIANTMIGGSTTIGDYSWVAPSVSLRDQINIGMNVTVGMGAVVTKDIPDNETWTGTPAIPLNEFVERQKKLKRL